MALRTRSTPTLSQPCAPVRAQSLSRRRLPPSSIALVPGNQAKPWGSLKSSATDGLIRLPCKPLSKGKLGGWEFGAKQSSASASPVCLLAPKDKPGRGGNQGLPWESFGEATENFKGKSIEEMLREQMRNMESNAGGGSGKRKPPGGGGRGRRGGGGGGSGDREESGASSFGVSDETLQVILATIGFLFVYFYVINGVEMTRLAKDYIKFLWTGSKSVRLRKAMEKWGSFLQPLLDKKELLKCGLERKIADAARSWFDGPTKYRHILRSYLTSNTGQ
ncbi:unnamed protein product [Linum trigynum]|uniref:Glycine-rich protein n=1 Tax=Linum trigynum TaxID=586398 RepID=A0AAV2G0R4_9ROSI